MAFKITMKPAGEKPDVVDAQRAAAAARKDPTDTYTSAEVVTELPPANTRVTVKLRVQDGSGFIFAVYAENSGFHDQPQEVWEQAAKRALTKFSALHDRTVADGPRHEFGRPMNYFIEARSQAVPVEMA